MKCLARIASYKTRYGEKSHFIIAFLLCLTYSLSKSTTQTVDQLYSCGWQLRLGTVQAQTVGRLSLRGP